VIKNIWKHRIPYLFIAPFFIVYGVFMGFPIVFSFFMSLCKWDGLAKNPVQFVGLANYIDLAQDPVFLTTVKNMLIYVPAVIITGTVLSFLLALALNAPLRFRGFFRAAFFIPTITSSVVIALTWSQIYNQEPKIGLINHLLSLLGIEPVGWLTSPLLALLSIIMMVLWATVGYNAILFLAGLKGIPTELYDAAEVDGASPWQKVWYITIPLISPTTIFVVIMGLIYALQVFEPMQIMTKGGPENSTMSFVLYLYKVGFDYYMWGYASAIAYTLFAIILITTFIYIKIRHKMGKPIWGI
jgi:multiple sugar transport system permease protein